MLMDAHLSHTHTLSREHTLPSAMGISSLTCIYRQRRQPDEVICKLIWWLLHLVIGMCTCTCSLHVYVHGTYYIVLSFRRPTSPPKKNNINVFSGHRANSREYQSVQCAFEWRFSWPHIRSIELSSGITFSWGIPLVWQQRQYTAFLQVLFYTM